MKAIDFHYVPLGFPIYAALIGENRKIGSISQFPLDDVDIF